MTKLTVSSASTTTLNLRGTSTTDKGISVLTFEVPR
jgi:hypothetical protein